MFRRTKAILLVLIALVSGVAPRASADEVARYLERHGLKRVLATHLEQQMETATAEERGELVLRLAGIYAELLDRESDLSRRQELEQQSLRLLEKAPPGSVDELRLALARRWFRSAEAIAENHRLRLASEKELAEARELFSKVIVELSPVRARLKAQLEALDRRTQRSFVPDEAGQRLRALHANCTFVNAWALYYQGWLATRDQGSGIRDQHGAGTLTPAREAEVLFGSLLNPEAPHPNPQDVSVDLRENEAIARSILGMALCKSLTSTTATAIAWIELLEDPRAYEPLRQATPLWKTAIYLERREYQKVVDLLQDVEARQMPLSWLRLVAAYALEEAGRAGGAGPGGRQAEELAKFAVLELASRGHDGGLQQVMDLAMRFGTQGLGLLGAGGRGGERGFALKYVQAVVEYQKVREAHGDETPTQDVRLVALYEDAANLLAAALDESDATAPHHATARNACLRLMAWCRYFQSRYFEAKQAFEAAWIAATTTSETTASPGAGEAAEALWMAIVSLEKALQAGDDRASEAQLNALLDRYLGHYPGSERTGRVRVRRILAQPDISEAAVDELLAIPPGSEMHEHAQRRAAEMLYLLFRESGGGRRGAAGSDRVFLGNRFLTVAVPLLSDSARQFDLQDSGDGGGGDRFVTRCRQVLEVALADPIRRPDAARAALEALGVPGSGGGTEASRHQGNRSTGSLDASEPSLRDEIDCRRVQLHLLSGELEAAIALADAMWERDSASLWTRLATRAVFAHAHAAVQRTRGEERGGRHGDAPGPSGTRNLELVIRYGGRVLHEFRNSEQPLEQPGAMAYHVAVAEASMRLWQDHGDIERGRAALFLFERLLAARPRHAAFLRATAILSEHLGDQVGGARAVECWRRLTAGLQPPAAEWFEARYHLIRLLATSDPARAREVMAQHRHLHPHYGPEPWGALLKGLDEQLGSEPAEPGPRGPS